MSVIIDCWPVNFAGILLQLVGYDGTLRERSIKIKNKLISILIGFFNSGQKVSVT